MESDDDELQSTNTAPYAVRHNPPPYLTSLTGCSTFDVPYTELQTDLDNDTLPAFAMVVPNTVNDMHDGPDPAAIHNGDTWLATELPKILLSAAYQSGNTVVFLTFDEGEFGPCSPSARTARTTPPTSPATSRRSSSAPRRMPGTTAAKLYNHYSLLRTTERLLGVRKRLGLARRARSMKRSFNL